MRVEAGPTLPAVGQRRCTRGAGAARPSGERLAERERKCLRFVAPFGRILSDLWRDFETSLGIYAAF